MQITMFRFGEPVYSIKSTKQEITKRVLNVRPATSTTNATMLGSPSYGTGLSTMLLTLSRVSLFSWSRWLWYNYEIGADVNYLLTFKFQLLTWTLKIWNVDGKNSHDCRKCARERRKRYHPAARIVRRECHAKANIKHQLTFTFTLVQRKPRRAA